MGVGLDLEKDCGLTRYQIGEMRYEITGKRTRSGSEAMARVRALKNMLDKAESKVIPSYKDTFREHEIKKLKEQLEFWQNIADKCD